MNNLGSLIQILVFVLVIAGPTIGAIARKVKSHAEEKRLEAERSRRRIDAIRTGRTSEGERAPVATSTAAPTAEQSRRARLEELARQRQAQIEELRRRAAAQRQAQQRPTAPRPAQAAPRPTQPAPRPAPPAGRPQQPARAPVARPAPARATPQVKPARTPPASVPSRPNSREGVEARQQAELARRRAEIQSRQRQAEKDRRLAEVQAVTDRASAERRLRRDVDDAPTAARLGMRYRGDETIAASLRDPYAIRRAIVINEILGTPVGQRDPFAG